MEKSKNKPETLECELLRQVNFGASKKGAKGTVKEKGQTVKLTKAAAIAYFAKHRISKEDYEKALKLK